MKNRYSMYELQNHPWMEMQDEDLEKSIEDAKLVEEEEEKKGAEDEEDLDYLDKLTLKDKDKSDSLLDPTDSYNKKKGSRRPISPRIKSSPRGNGIGKKGKGKSFKKKKPKVSK